MHLKIPLDELSEAAACRSKNRLPPPSRKPQYSMKSPVISQRVTLLLTCDTIVLASLLCLISFAVHYVFDCYSLFNYTYWWFLAFSFSSPFNFLSSEYTTTYLSWYWKELYNFGLLYRVLPCSSHDFLISSHAFSRMWLLVNICMCLPRNEILGLQKTHIWTNIAKQTVYFLFVFSALYMSSLARQFSQPLHTF